MKARFAALFVAATCTALIDLLYTMALRSAVEKMNRPGRRLQGNEDNLLAGVKAELDKIIEGLDIQDNGYRGFINIKASKYCEATNWTTPVFAEPLPAYGKVKVHGARFIKDPSDRIFGGRWVTKQYEYTPSLLLRHFPKKIVGDGEKIWMLAKKEQNGFSIWRRAQRDELRNQLNIVESHNWQHIDGQLTDIYPGPTHVWGVNKNGHVFACRQTCDGGWNGVAAPFVARSVAVGAEGRPVHSRGQPKWTTIGGRVMVWVKDKDGKIWMKPENPNAAFPGWALTQNVPPRITELLNERHPMSDFGVPDDLRLPYAWGVH